MDDFIQLDAPHFFAIPFANPPSVTATQSVASVYEKIESHGVEWFLVTSSEWMLWTPRAL